MPTSNSISPDANEHGPFLDDPEAVRDPATSSPTHRLRIILARHDPVTLAGSVGGEVTYMRAWTARVGSVGLAVLSQRAWHTSAHRRAVTDLSRLMRKRGQRLVVVSETALRRRLPYLTCVVNAPPIMRHVLLGVGPTSRGGQPERSTLVPKQPAILALIGAPAPLTFEGIAQRPAHTRLSPSETSSCVGDRRDRGRCPKPRAIIPLKWETAPCQR